MLDSYKKFMENIYAREDISSLCKKYGITDYTINEDETVDVHLSVFISRYSNLKRLPLNFNSVNGDFFIADNALETLHGCPPHIINVLSASGNNITSFEGGPKTVGNLCDVTQNKITTLKDCPTIYGSFFCGHNYLKSLVGCPKILKTFECNNNNLKSLVGCADTINGTFNCEYNALVDLVGGPKHVKKNIVLDHNKLTSLIGFPELYSETATLTLYNNPVYDVYSLFNTISAAEYMNEWEVIDVDNMQVSYLRICEVYKSLDIPVLKYELVKNHFDNTEGNYTLVN